MNKSLVLCNLYVFRHAETTDNANAVFSGWRDPDLTPRGLLQAQEISEQLKHEKIDYAFTSHLKRARRTLEVVLEAHPDVPVFVDDRLIERCYGLLQGRSKIEVSKDRPEWFAKVHRGYDFPPPEGESLRMVEKRTDPFVVQLQSWLQENPGNIAISCHGNSLRPIRRVFEHLSLKQMLQLENPQDKAMNYAFNIHSVNISSEAISVDEIEWCGVLVPKDVELASDPKNPLKKYY
jgi:2,3-bisphosphoglycerate-dependent phosphoglycerate mutase